jgi:hypothetical protein
MGGPPQFEGHSLDDRTRDMIIALRVICDAPVVITQGCYNAGGVAASAGTHDGGGAVDIRAWDLSNAQAAEVVAKARKVGFAAWHRLPSQGNWVEHIHCVAIGCPDLSRGAASQVTAYKNGRNGLANNGRDDGPRTWVGWTWEKYKKTYPALLTEDTMTPAQMTELKNFIEARTKAYANFDAKNTEQQLRTLVGNIETLEQRYAVAVNAYVAQLDAANDGAIAKLATDVAALKTTLATLTTAVAALPKA